VYWLIAIALSILGLLGPICTLIGLPGAWLLISLALLGQWAAPDTFNWWTLGGCVALAMIGEAVELAAGAAGSRHGGGSRRAGLGAIIGGIVGALGGAVFPPVIGAIIWGVVGAGVGAVIGEFTTGNRAWRSHLAIASAAATGKAVGTVIKTALTILIYLIVMAGAFVP